MGKNNGRKNQHTIDKTFLKKYNSLESICAKFLSFSALVIVMTVVRKTSFGHIIVWVEKKKSTKKQIGWEFCYLSV